MTNKKPQMTAGMWQYGSGTYVISVILTCEISSSKNVAKLPMMRQLSPISNVRFTWDSQSLLIYNRKNSEQTTTKDLFMVLHSWYHWISVAKPELSIWIWVQHIWQKHPRAIRCVYVHVLPCVDNCATELPNTTGWRDYGSSSSKNKYFCLLLFLVRTLSS